MALKGEGASGRPMKEPSDPKKVSRMRIATGLFHGVQPIHGGSPSNLVAGIATLSLMALLAVVLWVALSRPRPAGGGGWWRRYPDDQPAPWRPIPGLGSSPRPRRAGLRSSVCPTISTKTPSASPAPSRIAATS